MSHTGSTKLAGVIGWPVSHSLSPRLHGFWIERYAIDAAYLPLAVRPEHLRDVIKALPKLGFVGANVTLPHKEAVLRACDDADPAARRIGAANTLVIGSGGRVRASNSDGYGFLENLKAGAPEWRPNAGPVVVLGAGGAARAILATLREAGVKDLRLVNRTRARADALGGEFGATVVTWDKRAQALAGAALLVNTTVLGMVGQPPLDLDLDALPKTAAVNDIVYRPLETPLLKAAAARGNPVVDGLGMLLHQARPGFEAWFGIKPEVDAALRRYVEAGLEG